MPRVRVRGIYATALTEHFREPFSVVDPSPPIAARFDGGFDEGLSDVDVEDAPDRRGVGLTGVPGAVTAVTESLDPLARDVFTWTDPTPPGTVADARVTETLGRGAVVDLGSREGFLPYDAVDRWVEPDDEVTVQVRRSMPPWAGRRPEVGTATEVPAGPVTLVDHREEPVAPGIASDRAAELVRSLELVSAEVPAGWTVRFERRAADATIDELDAALTRGAEWVAAVDGADGGSPLSASWAWFGREARFELDDRRRAVATTMPGHHRIKAGTESASAAVDFVEAIGASPMTGEFPIEVVCRQFGPDVGDEITLSHGKPDGRRYALGTGTVTERDGPTVTVEREMTAGGDYDGLGVAREAGDVAVTRATEGRWWYPTVYRDEGGEVKGTYVNVCTPIELFPDAVTYVDLEIDVVRHADGTVERLDEADLEAAFAAGNLSRALVEKAQEVATTIEQGLAD